MWKTAEKWQAQRSKLWPNGWSERSLHWQVIEAVSNIARAIATEMALSSDVVEGVRMAGNIHDIGKISIPAEILSKPGTLTDIEFGSS